MAGTNPVLTQSFMNKFREMGTVDSSGNGQLTVHSGLLTLVGHDDYRFPTSSHF
jgi:dihydroxyacetone kinase-like predicted kinase